ncbi:LLM class F420-dependent oxidoreductase [Streptomyces minutiscleroticus]|uniref:LLM class F420-dependent oxidoreductase n=1 Tax=Streptomyces minutiscleroticus TaxID=68238 RepID=A0A918NRX3_9ACTN|nr:LLM class F420-dependent oxidoreductase [Streptomyces minutiscleroticus]GGX91238.1 LLM class F420-dependent oxidoreductase [Streptomyces minutiscleroticus]
MDDTTTADRGAPNALKEAVGRHGVWSIALRSEDPARHGEIAEAAAELEELGFGAVWLGGNSNPAHAAPLLDATTRLVVATGIQSIWEHDAEDTARRLATVEAAHPGRFLLGLGVSHAKLADQYRRPYAAMVAYLDALDAAGVSAGRRVLAALGPKMLRLSRDRAAGSHPYLVTPEHTAQAREILGDGPLLAPELKVVLDTDPDRARATARAYLAPYLELPNYARNFLRLGFTEDDLLEGGSERLVDAVFAWGDENRVRAAVDLFHDAGADHLALQLVGDDPREDLPREGWRRLAQLLD